MKTAGPLEKVIEKKLVDYVKSKGGHTRKWSSPSNTGVPDRIIVMPGGAVGFLELKRQGNVPTKKQHHEMALLKQMGAQVDWCDNLFDACAFVDYLRLIGMNNQRRAKEGKEQLHDEVKRTPMYQKWLKENPAGEVVPPQPGKRKSREKEKGGWW